MSKTVSSIILVAVSVSLLAVASGESCTKLITPVNETTSIEVCCEGYREINRTAVSLNCEPICDPACDHSTCISPNRCACDKGYSQSKSGACIPNVLMTFDTPTVNETKCQDGYQLTAEENCEPVCFDPCINGRCVAPNHCQCLYGFTFDFDTEQCEPMCNGKADGCIRGTCVGYNKCRCDNGTSLHKYDEFLCVDRHMGKLLPNDSPSWAWCTVMAIAAAAIVLGTLYIVIRYCNRGKSYYVEDV